MRFRKPTATSVTETEQRKAIRQEFLRAVEKKPEQQQASAQRPPNACCSRAYVVACYCGGARECPDHPGPVCFGSFSHD